jgi:hypothetical protein
LSTAGVGQFVAAWRADALTSTQAGTVTQFRDGTFAALNGTQAGVVPSAAVMSTAYLQPVIQPRGAPAGGPPAPPGGNRPDYMRLATDMALLTDASYLSLVKSYAADYPAVGTKAAPTAGSLAFFAAFAASMQKLQELGVPSPNTQLFTPSFAPLATPAALLAAGPSETSSAGSVAPPAPAAEAKPAPKPAAPPKPAAAPPTAKPSSSASTARPASG